MFSPCNLFSLPKFYIMRYILALLLLISISGASQDSAVVFKSYERCFSTYSTSMNKWIDAPCVTAYNFIFIFNDSVITLSNDGNVEERYVVDSAKQLNQFTIEVYVKSLEGVKYTCRLWHGSNAATFTILNKWRKTKYKLVKYAKETEEKGNTKESKP